MRKVMATAVVGLFAVSGLSVRAAEDLDDAVGRKLMTAAVVTFAAYLQQGGTISIQSASAAVMERYGLSAWKEADCVYNINASPGVRSRRYTLNFRNLTGAYQSYGSQIVFYGSSRPPLCFRDPDNSGLCFRDLVIQRPVDPQGVVNDVLFALKHGCPPKEEDLPGNRDPY